MTLTNQPSSSVSLFMDKKNLYIDRHFRWESFKTFIQIAVVFSSHVYNFDIFSKICHSNAVRVFDFIICQIVIGMGYMFMDCFIKLYTSKLNCNHFLNPLLRGVTYGLFLQTAFNSVIQSCYVADSFRYLVNTLQSEMPWLKCTHKKSNCLSLHDIMLLCSNAGKKISMNETSAHLFYTDSFLHVDRNKLTTRFFVMGLVWIFNFLIATVSDDTLIKIFFLVFVGKTLSTAVIAIYIWISTETFTVTAFFQLMDINNPVSFNRAIDHISFTYGVGYLGFYDVETMSPYTMVDTAVIIFSVLFTIFSLMRSWIIRVLYLIMGECVNLEIYVAPHYLLYAIFPMSTHFVRAHRLYTIYIYLNVTVGTSSYLTLLTLTMSKLLHNEFRSVKSVYIIGLLCCLGFGLSLPITVSLTTNSTVKGMITGLNSIVLYLGGFKVAIVMWVYGVQRFSTDIQFWLGFKPTKFWIICWILMPIVLLGFVVHRVYMISSIYQNPNKTVRGVAAIVWCTISFILVTIVNIKTITKYLLANNLAGLFKSSVKYGPPDPYDRARRRNYNETIQQRQCNHACQILDELVDCNHMPLMHKSTSKFSIHTSDSSIQNIFEAPHKRESSHANIEHF